MFPFLELCINAIVLMILTKTQNLLQAAFICHFPFHDKTFGSCHVNIFIFLREKCRLYIMILENPYMRKFLIVNYFFCLHEAFWHKSCIMFIHPLGEVRSPCTILPQMVISVSLNFLILGLNYLDIAIFLSGNMKNLGI